jgi:hypothetical protein
MPALYRGLWPQSIAKLSKYSVSFLEGQWRVTVGYDVGDGLRFLAVEEADSGVAKMVNDVKTAVAGQPGGAFYSNEFRHVIVPVKSGSTSDYYFAGRAVDDFTFMFEGERLSTRPVGAGGQPLTAGQKWHGPRPGVPYKLAARGNDIFYETPALTDADPPQVRPNMTRRVQLSKVLSNPQAVTRATQPVAAVKGHQGGRFYVNEHGAMFAPVAAGDGNGLDYVYCGQIDRTAWFPEPATG